MIRGLIFTTFILGLSACASQSVESPPAKKDRVRVQKAITQLLPTKGSQVSGKVEFVQIGDEVKVTAIIKGLKRKSAHGFHIHEFGDCSAPDATSAGGHYNPDKHQHGGPNGLSNHKRHAGDLGNITVNDRGLATMSASFNNFSVDGDFNPILGRSVIVHAGEDDLKTQPTGNAGARLGCGVIGVENKSENAR